MATTKNKAKSAPPKKPAPEKAAIDWDAVKRLWETDTLSDREIGRQHGVSHVSIGKRADKEGWTRRLDKRVEAATVDALIREDAAPVTTEVTSGNAPGNQATDEETIKLAAATRVQVVREHRVQIKSGRAVADTLFAQLVGAIGNRDAIEQVIIEDTADADDVKASAGARSAASARRTAMLKAVSLPAHAGVLRDLSVALKNFVPLERQAHGLDRGEKENPDEAKTRYLFNLNLGGRVAAG